MKMIWIAYDEALEHDVQTALAAGGPDIGFTEWRRVAGRGHRSEPHLMTPVWPKGNHVLMTCVPDDAAARCMTALRDLRQVVGRQGLKAFVVPVDDLT